MSDQDKPIHETLDALRERAGELDCLYKIEDLLKDPEAAPDDVLDSVVRAIPSAWRHPETCQAKIALKNSTFQSPGVQEAFCVHKVDILVGGKRVGAIEIFHIQEAPRARNSLFSQEKCRLLDTIAKRVSHFLSLQQPGLRSDSHRSSDEDDTSLRSQDSENETRRPALRETEYSGLCMTCVHSSTCAFPRRKDQPVLSCEQFAEHGKDHVETAATVRPPPAEPQAQMIEVKEEPSRYKGLCATCENRETCTFPKPEGGVWHCEEFV